MARAVRSWTGVITESGGDKEDAAEVVHGPCARFGAGFEVTVEDDVVGLPARL